ncbi:ArsC family reductase [soil metagenome]
MNDTHHLVRLYGLSTCDQVRKARAWFAERGAKVEFHDFKKVGVDPVKLAEWLTHLPWDALINKRGLTWRGLTPDEKAAVVDSGSAVELMLRKPSVIKRPVVEIADRLVVGFHPELYEPLIAA